MAQRDVWPGLIKFTLTLDLTDASNKSSQMNVEDLEDDLSVIRIWGQPMTLK